MTTGSIIAQDETSITVRVPVEFRNRQAGKSIKPPLGAPAWAPAAPKIDNTLIRAIVRGHRWRTMLESGNYATVRELALAEKANESYVCRLLRLTLLAPSIVDGILNGKQRKDLQLADLLRPLPNDWNLQFSIITSES